MILLYEILNKHKKYINYVTIHLTNPTNIILPASGRDFGQEWINWDPEVKNKYHRTASPKPVLGRLWSEDYKQQFTPTQVFPTDLFGAFKLSKVYWETPKGDLEYFMGSWLAQSVQVEDKHYSALCAALTSCTSLPQCQHRSTHCTETGLKGEKKAPLEKTHRSSSHRLALRGGSAAGMWFPQPHSQHQVCHCWWIFGWDSVCCFQWKVK